MALAALEPVLAGNPRAAPVTPQDRLGLTLCLAVILHVMLILGIEFRADPPRRTQPPNLEITLVTSPTTPPPDKPDMLAPRNATGGGDGRTVAPPSAPPAPRAADAAEVMTGPVAPPLPMEPMAPSHAPVAATPPPPPPPPAPARKPDVMTAPAETQAVVERRRKPTKPTPKTKPAPEPKPAETPAETPPMVETPPETPPAPVAEATVEPEPLPPSAQALITRSFAMASRHSELQDKLENRANRPRTKYVSATTQEFKYAAYMEAWRAKVERIGNINYPDAARQGKLSGALLLDVALKPDGSVLEIIVRRSSGHKVLDDAAVRIVELASPFAPFPDEIRREVDILHVTRTWKFLNSEAFQAQ